MKREIDFYERTWIEDRHQPSATLTAAFSWLRGHIPESADRPRLVHGDAGLHNLMTVDGDVSVMLDWELSHISDPAEDLAYCRTWVDQVLDWPEFLDIYQESGGPAYRPETETFYGMLGDLRVAIFAVRVAAGFQHTSHPELTSVFASIHYYTVFVEKVAQRLLADTST